MALPQLPSPHSASDTVVSVVIWLLITTAVIWYVFIAPRLACKLPANEHIAEPQTSPDTFENMTDGDDLRDPMLAALSRVEDILAHHSGPFASNCIIGSQYRQVNDIDEFTKDGIKILNHLLVSEDTSARIAVRLARFVGIAVDSRCHDGTTTSMLTFCALAKIAVEKINESYLSPERHEWTFELKEALEECLHQVNQLKITEQDILERCAFFEIETSEQEVRAAIAYHMAMISSKGDHDLATKISHIIRSSPKKIYGMYRNIPMGVETEEPYILKRQEFDMGVNANLGNMDHFNYLNNTQYLTEDAVIFATSNVISVQSMEAGFLQAFISTNPRHRGDLQQFGVTKGWEELHEGKRNLIIMAPGQGLDDPRLMELINQFNGSNPRCKISWFNYQMDHKLRTSFNKTLHYMAGVPLFDDVMFEDATKSLIGLTGIKPRVHLTGASLTISNLYERDGEVFHPLYRDPEAFKDYTDFCRETEYIIEYAQKNITNPDLDHRELTLITSFYRSLTCQEIYDIQVGGSKHDQFANQTVYEDAIGAALSAVNEGVILGGYAHLANRMMTYGIGMETRFANAFIGIVADSLRVADRADIADRIETQLFDKWSYLVADRESYRPGCDIDEYVTTARLDKDGLCNFLTCDEHDPILLQAYAGYHEQFKRFVTILPKLANTSHLVDMRRKEDAGLA
jgi:hypothetical protein